jgi:hypothetical protein
MAFGSLQLRQEHSARLGWLAVGSVMLYVGSFAIAWVPLLAADFRDLPVAGARRRHESGPRCAIGGFNLQVFCWWITSARLILFGYKRPSVSLPGSFSCRLVPETKGRTLEEINEQWRRD